MAGEIIDIISGLRVPRQVPLDSKTFSLSESFLANLGVSNNLAYTYYDGLKVLCLQERTTWEWREANPGEVGLIENNFQYPNDWIIYGTNYSTKFFNFFEITSDDSKTDKGGYQGTSQDLKNEIDSLILSGGGDKNFVFNQGMPSTFWQIQHNLDKYPSVTVIDSSGEVMEGAVDYVDKDNLTITFSAGFSGKATLN